MYKFIFIQFSAIALLTASCNSENKEGKDLHNEREAKQEYSSSMIYLNGVDLEFKQYAKGCVNEEMQRVEVSKKVNNGFVISYFRNGKKVIDKKITDSSFQIYIKSFISECEKLKKDTSSKELFFGTIKTIELSDGLHILKVSVAGSNPKDPFQDLVNIICSKNSIM